MRARLIESRASLDTLRAVISQGLAPVIDQIAAISDRVSDLTERADHIFHRDQIPQEVKALSPEHQIELGRAMVARRNEFWRALYEVPYVQERVVSTLRALSSSSSLVGKVVFCKRSDWLHGDKARRDRMLLGRVKEALHAIDTISARSVGGVTPLQRAEISEIIVTVPPFPERAIELSNSYAEKVERQMTAEIRSGAISLSPEDRRTCEEEITSLRGDLGGTPLQIRSHVSHMMELKESYLRIKSYMVMSLLGLAKQTTIRMNRMERDIDDASQAAMIGLMIGIERLDPELGLRLSTGVHHWISQFVREERRINNFIVSMPADKQGTFFKVRAQCSAGNEGPRMAEVFERFRIHGDEAQAYLLLLAPTFSLNSLPKMFDDRGCSDLVMDTREPSVEEQLHASNRAEEVEKALTILGPQEREILRMSFGLDGNGVMADPEIAKALEMTNERMKQIRRRALSILRKNSRLKNFGENPSVFGA